MRDSLSQSLENLQWVCGLSTMLVLYIVILKVVFLVIALRIGLIDILAANVLIHEEGRLQICDFGVAGILQTQRDKRSTWIGTPHWMPPEMFAVRGETHKYSSEVSLTGSLSCTASD